MNKQEFITYLKSTYENAIIARCNHGGFFNEYERGRQDLAMELLNMLGDNQQWCSDIYHKYDN